MSEKSDEAKLTSDMERIKILEGKISAVVDHVRRLAAENEKLRAQVKELKSEKGKLEDQERRLARLGEEIKRSDAEREAVKTRIEALIGQIDQLGL